MGNLILLKVPMALNIRSRTNGTVFSRRSKIEVEVHAAGLNFRDVRNVLGTYPGNTGPLGGECSGIITRIGAGVSRFSVGDRVFGIAPGAFSSFCTTWESYFVQKPDSISHEQAATLPVTFLTAIYGLQRLGQCKPGDKVMIHAAAGGVGVAAVQLCQRNGCEVFATAGKAEKQAFLESLGIPRSHIMSSRNTDYADAIQQTTKGSGVDVILNSLSGGNSIPSTLSCLAKNGRFIEIGKAGIWSKGEMNSARPDVQYHHFDLFISGKLTTYSSIGITLQCGDTTRVSHRITQ